MLGNFVVLNNPLKKIRFEGNHERSGVREHSACAEYSFFFVDAIPLLSGGIKGVIIALPYLEHFKTQDLVQ
jgi:hypothetical protein